MADHGYFNFYTPPEYEFYPQYQQHSYEDERYSVIENTLKIFMQQSMINMQYQPKIEDFITSNWVDSSTNHG